HSRSRSPWLLSLSSLDLARVESHPPISASRYSGPSVELGWIFERLGFPLLHLRQYTVGKEVETPFDVSVRHTAIAEVQHEPIGVDGVADERELFEYLIRCPPGHQFRKVQRCRVDPMFVDKLADLTVKLIALMGAELLRGHFIMFDDGLVIVRYPFQRHLFRTILVSVDEHEPAAERLRGPCTAVVLSPGIVIHIEIFFHRLPGLLRNNQQPNPEFGHDRGGIRRDRGRVRAPSE